MNDALLQTGLQVFGGGIFGFLIAKYSLRGQKLSKDLVYKKEKVKLFDLNNETPEFIKITIDKSAFTGDRNDDGEIIELKGAYAHSLIIKNQGNTETSNVNFEISCTGNDKIIHYSSSPEYSDFYNVCLNKKEKNNNVLRLTAPYINSGESIAVSLITTGESDDVEINVTGGGKGVSVNEHKSFQGIVPAILFFIFFLLSLGIVFDSWNAERTLGNGIPEELIILLGGKIDQLTVPVISFPFIHKAIAIGVFGVGCILSIRRVYRLNKI
ncbi:hypothetical protein [Vibrio furnissii]|uniref:hypothetical protein n=1 Tax=Vibrio furnissii TaxID=29494 RepID=UPI002572D2FA|nr:hypothetical protein [Vibrio furnissii]WJG20712.1 hypothetical protein QSU95_10385 [Vibrio furnissii]